MPAKQRLILEPASRQADSIFNLVSRLIRRSQRLSAMLFKPLTVAGFVTLEPLKKPIFTVTKRGVNALGRLATRMSFNGQNPSLFFTFQYRSFRVKRTYYNNINSTMVLDVVTLIRVRDVLNLIS
jgi:hypothetical protein